MLGFSELSDANVKKQPITISPDDSGQFHFSFQNFQQQSTGQFSDGQQIILAWHYQQNTGLMLKSFTEHTINIAGELIGTACTIDIQGALNIHQNISVSGSLTLKATAIQYKGLMQAEYIDIRAQTVLHMGITQCQSLRLLAEHAEFRGDVSVRHEAYVRTLNFILGTGDAITSSSFSEKTDIHATQLIVQPHTTFAVASQAQEVSARIIVDELLQIDDTAIMHLERTYCSAVDLNNKGHLNLDYCELNIDYLYQSSILTAKNSQMVHTQELIHEAGSHCSLSHCVVYAADTKNLGAQLAFHSVEYKGLSFNSSAGSVQLKAETRLVLDECFFLDTEADLHCTQSFISTQQLMHLLGRAHLDHSECSAAQLIARASLFESNHSKIVVSSLLDLNQKMILNHSKLHSKSLLKLRGTINAQDLELHAAIIEINVEQAHVEQLISSAQQFKIRGGAIKQSVFINNSKIITQKFDSFKHISLNCSEIHDVNPGSVCHNLNGQLILNNSKFHSAHQVQLSSKSKLKIIDTSLHINLLHSHAAFKARNSAIKCEEVIQNEGRIYLQTSVLQIGRQLTSTATVQLKEKSSLETVQCRLAAGSTISLDTSNLHVQESLLTTKDSSLQSQHSGIKTRLWTALGRVHLNESLLSAEELQIHNNFTVLNNNLIKVKGRVVLAKKGRFIIENTSKPSMIETPHLLTAPGSSVAGQGDLGIQAEQFDHLGALKITGDLVLEGTQLNNSGSIAARHITAGYDQAMVNNKGSMTAERIQAHSIVINLLGSINATAALDICGLLFFNSGAIKAPNYKSATLLSMDAGLLLSPPDCSAGWAGVAQKAFGPVLRHYLPTLTHVINLGLMTPELIKKSKQAYTFINQGKTFKNMRFHQVMPYLFNVKETLTQLHSAYHLTALAYNELTCLPETMASAFNIGNAKDWRLFETDVKKISVQAALLTMGIHEKESLLHFHSGLTLGGNTTERSAASVAVGLNASLSHASTTCYSYSRGFVAGMEAQINANEVNNSGYILGLQKLKLHANTVSNSGGIKGNNAHVNIRHLQQDGSLNIVGGQAKITTVTHGPQSQTTFDCLSFNISNNHMQHGAQVFYRDSFYHGSTLVSDGFMQTSGVQGMLQTVTFGQNAVEQLKESTFIADNITDLSQLQYEGNVGLLAKNIHHGGTLQQSSAAGAHLISIVADKAQFEGGSNGGSVYFNIKELPDLNALIAGTRQYANYKFSFMHVDTTGKVIITDPIARESDSLILRADQITWNTKAKGIKELHLESKKGDVVLLKKGSFKQIFVKSARNIWNKSTLNIIDHAFFEAEGVFYNLGSVSAKFLGIVAAEIQNISGDSKVANQMGAPNSIGTLKAESQAYLESTKGNIENLGGEIIAGDYLQLKSANKILNMCSEIDYQGKHDARKIFRPGLIAGGIVKVHAAQSLLCDASNFFAGEALSIHAKHIKFDARQHLYIDEIKKKSNWWGSNTSKKVTRKTDVFVSSVHCAQGATLIEAETVDSLGTQFSAKEGTIVATQGKQTYKGLIVEQSQTKTTKKLWGLNRHYHKQNNQAFVATRFVDPGVTQLKGSLVDLRGALLCGEGSVVLDADIIKFAGQTLNHEIKDKAHSVFISAPCVAALLAYKDTGSFYQGASAADSTLAKANVLLASENGAALTANGLNFTIDAFNKLNTIASGLLNDNLAAEAYNHYGLGGAEGFSPSVSVGLRASKTTIKYQTLSPDTGIQVGGDVFVNGSQQVALANGAKILARTVDINTPELLVNGAVLKSSVQHSSSSASVGVSAAGINSASVAYAENTSKSVTHEQALIRAEHVRLHHNGEKINHVVLNNASIQAGTADIQVNVLDVSDAVNKVTESSHSGSASTTGLVSVSEKHSQTTSIAQTSGIHVREGLNKKGHIFDVNTLNMTGGAITTDGINNARVGVLNATSLETKHKSAGFSMAFNLNDVLPQSQSQPEPEVGAQAIHTVTLGLNHERKTTRYTPVFFAAIASTASIGQSIGAVHTGSADGSKTIHANTIDVQLDVPLLHHDKLMRGVENIKQGLLGIKNDVEIVTRPVELLPPLVIVDELSNDSLIEYEVDDLDELQQIKELLRLYHQRYGRESEQQIKISKEFILAYADMLKTNICNGYNDTLDSISNPQLDVSTLWVFSSFLPSLAYNIFSHCVEDPRQTLTDLSINTAAKSTFYFILKNFIGVANPVVRGLRVGNWIERLTYNQNTVDEWNNQANKLVFDAHNSRRKGNYVDFATQQVNALLYLFTASIYQARHTLITIGPETAKEIFHNSIDAMITSYKDEQAKNRRSMGGFTLFRQPEPSHYEERARFGIEL